MEKESALLRLRNSIEYLKSRGRIHIDKDIVEGLGMNKGNVSRALNGNPRYFTEGFLRRFGAAYSDYINTEWLISGTGQMAVPDRSLKPHFDASASAGFMAGLSAPETGADLRTLDQQADDYDFTISARGDSMLPEIEDGDILACRVLSDRLNPPLGEICVIDTVNGAAVKQVAAVLEDSLLLHSLNPDYPDYDVSFPDLLSVARVVSLLRSLTRFKSRAR